MDIRKCSSCEETLETKSQLKKKPKTLEEQAINCSMFGKICKKVLLGSSSPNSQSNTKVCHLNYSLVFCSLLFAGVTHCRVLLLAKTFSMMLSLFLLGYAIPYYWQCFGERREVLNPFGVPT